MFLSMVNTPIYRANKHKGGSEVGMDINSAFFFRFPISTGLPKFSWIDLKYERGNFLINFYLSRTGILNNLLFTVYV